MQPRGEREVAGYAIATAKMNLDVARLNRANAFRSSVREVEAFGEARRVLRVLPIQRRQRSGDA